MERLKLECLVKGYEDTFFEVGQVWETKVGYDKVKVLQLNPDNTIFVEGRFKYSVGLNGKFNKSGLESNLDLHRLVTSKTTASDPKLKTTFEQKTSSKYMVFVENRNNPVKVHNSYELAEKEAKRLAEKEIGYNVSIMSVVKTFKSKVIVEEVEM